MNKAIFLDRDGVINAVKLIDGKPYPPKDLSELNILPKVDEALFTLKGLGYLLIVITNQPDVSRGKAQIKTIENINNFLKTLFPLDDFYTCYHDDIQNCDCRKPRPGNILRAVTKYDIDINSSFMIGDRWRDIQAGLSAGCKTFFIDYNYNEKRPENYDFKVESLHEASIIISELI
jgi:D-glycero-D-manno-heptose 1,7-bisphosphate phosphatase